MNNCSWLCWSRGPRQASGAVPWPDLPRLSGPELHVPMPEPLQAVGIGHHDVDLDRALSSEADSNCRADGGCEIGGAHGPAHGIDHGSCSGAHLAHVEAACDCRQQAYDRQPGEASADTRGMIEHGDGEGGSERAQRVALAGNQRIGYGEERRRNLRREPVVADGGQRRHRLGQCLGRAARFRNHDEPCRSKIERGEPPFQRAAVEIVVKPCARSRSLALIGAARNVPAR